MDIGDWLFTPNCELNEQIARQIFDILPEKGVIMVIMDRDGNCRTSDSEGFSELNIGGAFLKELCAQIDDGTEPVLTQVNDCSIIAAQLVTERTDCGYVIIALPQCGPATTLVNIDLAEALLNQTGLVAKLVEKNNLLHELQMKQLSLYTQSETASN